MMHLLFLDTKDHLEPRFARRRHTYGEADAFGPEIVGEALEPTGEAVALFE